jgi:predicted dehydrogenase
MPTRTRPSASPISRRTFLASAAALAGGGPALLGSPACAATVQSRPGESIRLGVVGVGGRGRDNLDAVRGAGVDIVALCDCDLRQATDAFGAFPDARHYTDWRKMLEREKDLEAVLVSTPDHSHAVVAVAAMKLGKHVYCEKPLAHSIWEAREMARVAKDAGVATQMGTQGHAFEGTRRAVEAIRAGVLGEVTELHVWTDRPAGWWPQGIDRPTDTPPVPKELDWDVWLGPAAERPYHPAYVPFKWRGFWDFGTGAIGDMGIHNLDTAFWGLELGLPSSAIVKDASPALTDPRAKETAPAWSIIELRFPARGSTPAVTMTWYDGGKLPPAELFHGEPLIGKDGGSLVIGRKGTLFTRTWHGGEAAHDMFVLLPRKAFEGFEPPAPALPRVSSHHHEWLDACRGRGQALSNFGYASTLTEALLVGNLALRAGGSIEWDAAAMRATGASNADSFIRPAFRTGWSL